MAGGDRKALFVTLVLWLGIFGALAVMARLWVLPALKQKTRGSLVGQTSSAPRYKSEVTFAADAFSGYCVVRSEEMSRRLRQQGIKLTVVDDKADYVGRLKQLQQGSVQMAVFTVDSLLKAGSRLGEIPACVVYIIDETQGADAIVAHSNAVASIADLNSAGARVVFTPDSPSEFLARVMVANFDLPKLPAAWGVEADGAADVLQRFRAAAGRRDKTAFVVWQPYVSKALREPGAHILLDSSRLKGFIVDVIVVQREFLVANYPVVKAVVESYARAAYAYREPARMAELVMQDARSSGSERLSEREAAELVKGIQWKNTTENYAHFGLLDAAEARGLDPIEDMVVKIGEVLVKTGSVKEDPAKGAPNTVFCDRVLRAMKAERFHPGRDLNVIAGADPGAADPEAVRGREDLRALTEPQWQSLVSVGELRVEPISFGRGTAAINARGLRDLGGLARTLKSWPDYYVTVVGKARPEGDADANRELAGARAEAVRQALVAEGVGMNRIRPLSAVASEGGGAAQTVSFVVGQLPY